MVWKFLFFLGGDGAQNLIQQNVCCVNRKTNDGLTLLNMPYNRLAHTWYPSCVCIELDEKIFCQSSQELFSSTEFQFACAHWSTQHLFVCTTFWLSNEQLPVLLCKAREFFSCFFFGGGEGRGELQYNDFTILMVKLSMISFNWPPSLCNIMTSF